MSPGAAPGRGPRPHWAVLHIALVYLAVRAFWMVSALPEVSRQAPIVETLAKVGLWVVPCLLFAVLTMRQSPRASWRELGLGGAPWRGVAFGVAATMPMAFALAFMPAGGADADVDVLLDSAVIGPFAEEVLFRGFLCFQLVRVAGWRVGPAIVVSSAMFALAHLPHVDLWSADLLVSGAAYALGGALFAWIAWRWQSLWPAAALHGAMNFWWVLAEGGARLQFGITPMTVAHALAIAIAVAVTVVRSRRLAGERRREAAMDIAGPKGPAYI